MSEMDIQWNEIATNILEKGWDEDPTKVRAVYPSDKAPAPTRYIIDARMEFGGSFAPIQFGKTINPEKPFGEIDWITRMKSNRLEDLHAKGINFWDNWEVTDGRGKGLGHIGKAYGYQMGKKVLPFPTRLIRKEHLDPSKAVPFMNGNRDYVMLDQVDFLIQSLLHNPHSRRHVLSLWNIDDLPEMKLPPCVWRSEWMVDGDDKLVMKIGSRSSDLCLGVPFNVIQYYALQRMVAQAVGLETGKMIFDMGNVHIYDRHIEGAEEIISRKATDKVAKLILPPGIRNFYEFDMNSFVLDGYDPKPGVKFEIAE